MKKTPPLTKAARMLDGSAHTYMQMGRRLAEGAAQMASLHPEFAEAARNVLTGAWRIEVTQRCVRISSGDTIIYERTFA